jgi:hypothetical protein
MHIDGEEVLSVIQHHAIAFIEKFARQHQPRISIRSAKLPSRKAAGNASLQSGLATIICTRTRELFADENNATVFSTTAVGRIAYDRFSFAIAFGREAATVNAVVAKPIHDGLGTIIRKL